MDLGVTEVLHVHSVVGRPALLDIVSRHIPMPNLARPLYSAAMKDVTMCFTGFRIRQQLVSVL